MGTLVPNNILPLCIEEVDFKSPISEAVMTKIAGSINGLIDRKIRLSDTTGLATGLHTWQAPGDVDFVIVVGRGAGGGGGGGASNIGSGTDGTFGGRTQFDPFNSELLETVFMSGEGGEAASFTGGNNRPGRFFAPGQQAGGLAGGSFEDVLNLDGLLGTFRSDFGALEGDVTYAQFLARSFSQQDGFSGLNDFNISFGGPGGVGGLGPGAGGGSGAPAFDSLTYLTVVQNTVYDINIGAGGVGGAPGGGAGSGAGLTGRDGFMRLIYFSDTTNAII